MLVFKRLSHKELKYLKWLKGKQLITFKNTLIVIKLRVSYALN